MKAFIEEWLPEIFAIAFIIALLLGFVAWANAADLKASWYSVQSLKDEGTWFYSKGQMANGKYFADNGFTCASWDYSLGQWLCVTNLANNCSVVVQVTDRTARRFKSIRIDLSKGAFQRLADLRLGLINVNVEVVK